MKRWIAYVIGTCGLVCLIVVILLGIFDPFDTTKQMDAAKKYMDSLTDKDIQTWIQRAKTDLSEAPTNFDVPPDLQTLGITGIEMWDKNEIEYVWLGGMDSTRLVVERMSNGDFQVFAVYTPYSNRMIWPRQVP